MTRITCPREPPRGLTSAPVELEHCVASTRSSRWRCITTTRTSSEPPFAPRTASHADAGAEGAGKGCEINPPNEMKRKENRHPWCLGNPRHRVRRATSHAHDTSHQFEGRLRQDNRHDQY